VTDSDAAGRVQAFLDARGPDRDNVIATAGPRSARYSKPRLRVDDLRAVLAEVVRLDAEFGKASARWHDERRLAAKAEVERDRARETLAAVRALVAKWGGPTTVTERLLADAIIALTGGPLATAQRVTDANAMRARLLATQVERLSAKWLGNEPAATVDDNEDGAAQ
jgi:hypothetical protein